MSFDAVRNAGKFSLVTYSHRVSIAHPVICMRKFSIIKTTLIISKNEEKSRVFSKFSFFISYVNELDFYAIFMPRLSDSFHKLFSLLLIDRTYILCYNKTK